MSQRFYTITEKSTGEFKDRGSKFLGFAFPVSSEEDLKSRQEELRKEFYDARHHCFAYILGTDDQLERSNDDGEPRHSAGDPILGQIKSKDLTNVLVVVVRYFGGTKLGVPGLINAYRQAAAEAIENSTIYEIIPKIQLELSFGYDSIGTVENWMTDFECEVMERDFQATCVIRFHLKKELFDSFQGALKDHYMIKLTVDDD